MVVNMMKCSPWQSSPAPATRKFQVTVNQMKLEGFIDGNTEELESNWRERVVGIRLSWRGERKTVFYRNSRRRRRDFSGERTVVESGGGGVVEWEDEFQNLCCFTVGSSPGEFCPWDVSFTLLLAECKKGKMNVVGKVSLDIGEMASKKESQLQTKLPITLQLVGGVSREATLWVSLGFVEIRDDSQDSPELGHNSIGANPLESHSQRLEIKTKEKKKQLSQEEVSLGESDESTTFGSETGSTSSPSSETRSMGRVKKVGLFSWKRRRLSFKPEKEKSEPLIKKTSEESDENKDDLDPRLTGSPSVDSTGSGLNQKPIATSEDNWETRELTSRDGQTKLKADLFFASFDQRSDKAAGESACTALVAVIAHWLHSNQAAPTPTKPEFDHLIMDGSSEWRNLCQNETYLTNFPNRHFDLETILRAGIRPLSVLPDESFVGFFGPEKFEALKGAMSFDDIWGEVSKNSGHPRVYIVSWNDHFFVLKAEVDAYYIIDTLGERLYEGCENAYILRFDETTVMYANKEKEKINEGEIEGKKDDEAKEENEEIICRGKECCREFMKRFLVAIQLKELESEEEKERVSYYSLHQRLQIEFNFSICLPSLLLSPSRSPSSPSNLASSLFSNEENTFVSED
ncbi:hypothetical protein LguiB_027581 [Lonicera macranthoides]